MFLLLGTLLPLKVLSTSLNVSLEPHCRYRAHIKIQICTEEGLGGEKVIQIGYKKNKSSPFLPVALISHRISSKGEQEKLILHHEGDVSYVNQISEKELYSFQWQKKQVEHFRSAESALIKEAFLKAGDNLMNLLFFTYRGIKDLNRVMGEYEGAKQDLSKALKTFDQTDEEERKALHALHTLEIEMQKLYEGELLKAYGALAGWAALDAVTIFPGIGAKAVEMSILPLSREIAKTRAGKLTSMIGDKVLRKTKRKFNQVGIRVGLFSSVAKIQLFTAQLSQTAKSLQLVNYGLKQYQKAPGLQKFLALDHIWDCNVGDAKRKRIWLLSAFYAIPLQLSSQFLTRGPQNFFLELDRVLHDLLVSEVNHAVWGRCKARFDDEPAHLKFFERWRNRQFFYHFQNYTDSSMTFLKYLADQDGITPEELEYIVARHNANMVYTLTKGPVMGSYMGKYGASFNSKWFDLFERRDLQGARDHAAMEFWSRYVLGLFSHYSYLNYREGYSRNDLHEEEKKRLDHALNVLKAPIEEAIY